MATYFAVRDNFESDGALWQFNLHELHTRKQIEISEDEDFRRNRGGRGLTVLMSEFQSERMIAQQGVYTVSSYILADHADLVSEALVGDVGRNAFTKVRIPQKLKLEFLRRLTNMNVLPSALFPGIDGVGRFVRDAYLIYVDEEQRRGRIK